jgi:hypothetical protein
MKKSSSIKPATAAAIAALATSPAAWRIPGADFSDPADHFRAAATTHSISLNSKVGLHGTESVLDRARTALNNAAAGMTPDMRAKIAELEAEARDERLAGTPGPASRRLHAARVETVNNYLAATSMIAAGFFQLIELKPDETPVYLGETGQEVTFAFMGQNGGVNWQTIDTTETSGTPIEIRGFTRTSGWKEYQTMDVNRGVMKDSVTKTLDIARDLAWLKEGDLWNLLKAQLGAFSGKNTGRKANRAFVLHSSIKSSVLPTTTQINVTAGSKTKIQKILSGIINYETSWGRGTFQDGDLRATGEIFITSNEVGPLFDELDITQPLSDTGEKIVQSGDFAVRVGNRTFQFIPIATTQMTAGKVYPKWNKPAGILYTKPSLPLNREVIETFGDAMEYERRKMTAWMAMFCPAPWAPRFVEFQYQ